MFDAHRFSTQEIFSNNNGKTSSGKVIGVVTSFVCLFLLVILSVFFMYNLEFSAVILQLIDKITVFFGIAGGLMGVKSISTAISGSRIDMSNEANCTDSEEAVQVVQKTKKKKKAVKCEDIDEEEDLSGE